MGPLRPASLLGLTQRCKPQTAPVNLRLFTQNSQLLLVHPSIPRPQLPFLHPLSQAGQNTLNRKPIGQRQILRYLSTERKRAIVDQIKLSGKYILWSWVFGGLFLVIFYGIHESTLEATYPTPAMWTYISRKAFREAKFHEEPEAFETRVIDWVMTGNLWRSLLLRLEDPEIDGAGVLKQDVGEISEREGELGLDVSNQPYEWRRGYWITLMGAARAAENLDGFVRDNTRGIVFPPDVVIGPSNPNPRPVPPGAATAPLEKDCSPFCPSPQTFYMKALTTKGFTTNERLQAALAYADWLDFKNLTDTAEEMYKWALDIAVSGLEHPEKVLDPSTGVIKPDAPLASENILLATTSLATHHARRNNLSAALPIFLSALRARRSLSAPPKSDTNFANRQHQNALIASIASVVGPMIVPPPFPPPPPSGDEQAFRTAASICEEAGLMAYIGEVLFASSKRADGLTWTREAVDVAEEEYRAIVHTPDEDDAAQRCGECLVVGLENWQQMVARLAADGRGDAVKEEEPQSSGWLWGASKKKESPRYDWAREEQIVEERANEARNLLSREKVGKPGAAGFRTLLYA